jgi:hypothetical protein
MLPCSNPGLAPWAVLFRAFSAIILSISLDWRGKMMELKDLVARIEVLGINNNSVQIQLRTFHGEDLQLNLTKGDVIEAAVSEDPEPCDDSLLEGYLSGPIPQELLLNLKEESTESFEAPAPRQNKVFEELQALEPQLQNSLCPQCGRTAQLSITHEGIVLRCRECGDAQRIDSQLLQRLIDSLDIVCFSCISGKLKSEAMDYANILKCLNPNCGSTNSWRGVSDRLQSEQE